MRELIVVLGHFDDTVHLTAIGRERLDLGIALLRDRPDAVLTVTGCPPDGADGQPFPRSAEARDYLLEHGVQPAQLARFVDSRNTVEDAFLSEPLVAGSPARLLIATSDYHAERARLIFERVFAHLPVEVFGAPHSAASDERRALAAHEQQALRTLKQRGLYWP